MAESTAHKSQDRHTWRTGYTTGSCAAGAAKAACLVLKGNPPPSHVSIVLPDGGCLTVPVHKCFMDDTQAYAAILKDGGDDPDITHGLVIEARVRILSPSGRIHLRGGGGVGMVTKKGLAVPVGEPAINPVPRQMIEQAVRQVFPVEEMDVLIEVPAGAQVAVHTLNPRLGITGGISILGTSGIVRPMSEEAFKASILPELDQAAAYGHQVFVLTPGNYGFRAATGKMGVPAEAVVQTSNFIGYIMEEAVYRGIRQLLLFGHIGKLIKVAGGIFHTHNRVADARMEILVAHAALAGVSGPQLRELSVLPTVEGAASELCRLGYPDIIHRLAERASARAMAFLGERALVGTVFTLLDGSVIGWDQTAIRLISGAGWQFPG